MTMRLDPSILAPEEFWQRPTPFGTLYVPTPIKHTWRPEERIFRSVVLADDGTVISSGFPKFHNLGEVPDQDVLFEQAAREGGVSLTDKLDGSLVIQDWINGQVHTRSRGSGALPDFMMPALETAEGQGIRPESVLGDPQGAHLSLLYEYTAPDNRIVLPYRERRMTFLGAMDKRTMQMVVDPVAVRALADAIGAPMAGVQPLRQALGAYAAALQGVRDIEGVVARYQLPDGTWALTKLKTEWYRRLHSLVDGVTPRRAGEIAIRGRISGRGESLDAMLHSMGLDAEMISYVRDSFVEAVDKVARAEAMVAEVAAWVDARRAAATDRRSFVNAVRSDLAPDQFHMAMSLLDGHEERAFAGCLAALMEEPATEVLRWLREGPLVIASAAGPQLK